MFDWIIQFVQQTGYVGIALLMFAENVFPPIPSELIMPLAGYTAAQGEQSLFLVITSGTVGSVLGALFWYYIGSWFGSHRLKRFASRHGRWLTLSPEEVDQAQDLFTRYQTKAVLFGRLIPAVRSLISVPAGVTGMPIASFLFWTALGTALWSSFLAGAGYLLQSQYALVGDYLNPISNVAVGLITLWYLYRVAAFKPRPQQPSSEHEKR